MKKESSNSSISSSSSGSIQELKEELKRKDEMIQKLENKPFKVRDKRKEDRYYIDNEFLNGYAKQVGWQGQVVYAGLCRHANREETCFPSLKHLADELGIGISSVQIGLENLKEFDIIASEIRMGKTGKRISSFYYLLDRSEWKPVLKWSNRPRRK